LNRDTTLSGVDGYEASKDVLRTRIKPAKCAQTETFTIEFTNLSTTSAELKIQWEQTAVSIPIKLEVRKKAQENIEKAISEQSGDWRVYRNAANYYNNEGIQSAKALEYIDRSISLKEDNWYSHWLRAQLLYKNKKTAEAKKAAQKSIELGEAAAVKDGGSFTYKSVIEKEMAGWK
jgi:tetratricopeptide (TPR) repeat protein